MARRRTIGWEINTISLVGTEGINSGSATVDSAFARSGSRSAKFDSGVGNAAAFLQVGFKAGETLPAIGTTVYCRAYFYFDNLPTAATTTIARIGSAAQEVVSARLTSGGKLQLFNSVAGTQIGSDSVVTLAAGTWYRVELSYLSSASVGTQAAELQLDGSSVASGTSLTLITNTNAEQFNVGWLTAPGASLVCHADDYAFNDDQGSAQNSWPGAGKILLLVPTGDNAVGTGWLDGDGAGTLFGSVDNAPPAGAATPANGTQIKNLTSTTTGNYDANMTTYTAAGLVSTDTITLVQAICNHAEAVATATKAGAVQIVSNPVQSVEDSFTYGDDLGAMGAYPTNWPSTWGTAQYAPSVTLGTAPVLRAGKRTATTREVEVDLLGLYVEYVPATPTPFPPWPPPVRTLLVM